MTPLTNKILAYRELPAFNFDDCIDWAIEMLSSGCETPSLLILAGLSKPTNSFEAESYLLSSLQELNLEIPERPQAIFNYCRFFIEKIARSENVKENLSELYKVAHTELDDTSIFDFCLLYWAWGDLDYGQDHQYYWPDADKDNIERITVNTARKWLASVSFPYQFRPMFKNNKTYILLASMIILLLSFTQNCYCTTSNCSDSIIVFLLGWFAVLSGGAGITWLANPLLITSWFMFKKKPKVSAILSLIALLFSLSFLLFDSVTANENGQSQKIISYKTGYWLWVGSSLVMFIGSGLFLLKNKPTTK